MKACLLLSICKKFARVKVPSDEFTKVSEGTRDKTPDLFDGFMVLKRVTADILMCRLND